MSKPGKQDKVLTRLVRWGEQQPQVRAMLMTSTRAIPGSSADVFSDYDIELVVLDVHSFHASRDWLEAFGRVLVLYRDPIVTQYGDLKTGYVVQFEGGLKIDFTIWSVGSLQRLVAEPELPDELDAGYQVLLDKDRLLDGLKPPTFKAYIPKPPTESEYLERIEMFFLDATYVAKYLWRDDLVAAIHIFDQFLKHEQLMPILNWHLETDHQWSVKPGLYGRRLKQWLRPDLWAALESTYTGIGLEENWQALFNTIDLMRKAALEVGDRLGFAYPQELHRKAVAYLQQIKNTEHTARNLGV